MTQNLAALVRSVSDAQRLVRDATRQTPEWRDAQGIAVQARLNYWNAMRLTWDVRHPRAAAPGAPRATAGLMAPSGAVTAGGGGRSPAPARAPTAADAARARRGFAARACRCVVRSALP